MIFKMNEMDFFVTIRGQEYIFTHVDGMQLEDPERNRLTRGANSGNTIGIPYREGVKEAKTLTVTVLGMPAALHNLLKEVYVSQERVDCGGISRVDGSRKTAKNAILAQPPQQMNIDDSPESMNTGLIFESYDVSEVHKS